MRGGWDIFGLQVPPVLPGSFRLVKQGIGIGQKLVERCLGRYPDPADRGTNLDSCCANSDGCAHAFNDAGCDLIRNAKIARNDDHELVAARSTDQVFGADVLLQTSGCLSSSTLSPAE